MSQTPFPDMFRATYRCKPQQDFLKVPQTRNFFPTDTKRDALNERMEIL